MRKLIILLCITTVVSCFNAKKTFEGTVNFEKITVKKTGDKLASDSAYEVSIVYCNPTDAPDYLSDSILKNTKLLLASWFDLKGQFDLNATVTKHFDEYRKQIAANNLPSPNVFTLLISPEEIYQNEHIISLAYNWMVYEGGAHPNSGTFCFVVDKNTGTKVSYKSLLKGDEAELLKIAEAEFRTQSGIKADEKIYDLYWFKDKKFHLTDNYRFTSEGLVFYYNPYEIAPYSFGLIKLTLPYAKIEKLIEWK